MTVWKGCPRKCDGGWLFQDRVIKSTVFKIQGSVPAGNFIQLPKSSSQSLGLTGRFMYLCFKPTPSKYFVVHVDVATSDGLVIRISFSNLFKEFKGTSTWLQFPFICKAEKGSVGDRTAINSKGERLSIAFLQLLNFFTSFFSRRSHRARPAEHSMDNLVPWLVFNANSLPQPQLFVHEEYSLVREHEHQERIHERHGIRTK